MKYWNDLEGAIFFNKVFSRPVEIGVVTLHSLKIDNNNPEISIGLDILDLPDNPPSKWAIGSYNTCRIGLTCAEISNLTIKNLPNANKFNMAITGGEDLYLIQLCNELSIIEFNTKYPLLGGPSVYMNGSINDI